MKHLTLFHILFLFLNCTLIGINCSNGQTYIPATSYEFNQGNFPGIEHSSCYQNSRLLISAWDAPLNGGEVIWQVMNTPYDPTSVGLTGTLVYPIGVRDLEVAVITVNNTYWLYVAYHEAGSGHKVDVYPFSILSGPGTVTTTILSTQGNYSRISIDSHNWYAIGIVWEDNFRTYVKGYSSFSGTLLTSSNILVNNGTAYETLPDVAFSHTSNNPSLNIVTYDLSFHAFVFCRIGMSQLLAAVSSITATVVDVNGFGTYTSPDPDIYANLDCVDHASNSWCYTWSDGSQIFARSSGGVSSVLNDGSILGTFNISSGSNTHPFVTFSNSYFGQKIYFGWFTDFSGSNQSYVGLITDFSMNLVSPINYFEIPASPGNGGAGGGSNNVLSFCKNTELSNTLYCIYPQATQLHHKFHLWTNTTSFKNSEAHIAQAASTSDSINVTNPFTEEITLSFTNSFNYDIKIYDLAGNLVYYRKNTIAGLNQIKLTGLDQLLKGSYILQLINNDNGDLITKKLIKV